VTFLLFTEFVKLGGMLFSKKALVWDFVVNVNINWNLIQNFSDLIIRSDVLFHVAVDFVVNCRLISTFLVILVPGFCLYMFLKWQTHHNMLFFVIVIIFVSHWSMVIRVSVVLRRTVCYDINCHHKQSFSGLSPSLHSPGRSYSWVQTIYRIIYFPFCFSFRCQDHKST